MTAVTETTDVVDYTEFDSVFWKLTKEDCLRSNLVAYSEFGTFGLVGLFIAPKIYSHLWCLERGISTLVGTTRSVVYLDLLVNGLKILVAVVYYMSAFTLAWRSFM